MMFEIGPKFHHIASGGDFNLEGSNGEFAAGGCPQASLQKFYDRVAPFYGIWAKLVESRASRYAYDRACLSRSEAVIEVAMGSGEFFSLLRGTQGLRRCVGVDLSSRMLARTRSRLVQDDVKSPELCCADACHLPFRDGTFDVLFNFYMLDLFSESGIAAAAAEFRRVLLPPGRLIVLSMACQARGLNAAWMWLYNRSPLLVGGCRPVPVAAILARNGWRIDAQERISQWGFRSELIVATASQGNSQP